MNAWFVAGRNVVALSTYQFFRRAKVFKCLSGTVLSAGIGYQFAVKNKVAAAGVKLDHDVSKFMAAPVTSSEALSSNKENIKARMELLLSLIHI